MKPKETRQDADTIITKVLKDMTNRENDAVAARENIKNEKRILEKFIEIHKDLDKEPFGIQLTLPQGLFILCKKKGDPNKDSCRNYENEIGISGICISQFSNKLLLNAVFFSVEKGNDLYDSIDAENWPEATEKIAEFIEKYPDLMTITIKK